MKNVQHEICNETSFGEWTHFKEDNQYYGSNAFKQKSTYMDTMVMKGKST